MKGESDEENKDSRTCSGISLDVQRVRENVVAEQGGELSFERDTERSI